MKKFALLSLFSLFLLSACGAPVDSSPQKLGKADAPILIEEFSDPQCPACAAISPQVEQIVRDNPDLARMEYYHFPLSYHEYAFIGAEAVQCAGDQGQFFEFLDTVFKNQDSLNEDYLYKVADSLELNRDQFDTCLNDHTYKKKILSQMAEGSRRRLPGTPSIFVNGQMIRWSDAETFLSYLKSL